MPGTVYELNISLSATPMLRNILVCILLFVSWPCTGQDPGPFTENDTKPLLEKLKNSGQDTNKVLLLFKLSDQYYYRQNRQQIDINRALFYTRAAKNLSILLSFHKGEGISELQLSRILPKMDRREEGREAVLKAIGIFTKYNEYFQLGEAYYTLSGYYSITGKEIQQRISLAEKSSDAFGQAGNKEKQGHIYQQLGDLYLTQGAIGKGLAALKQSLVFFEAARYKNLIGIYDLLGNAYVLLGTAQEAIKYQLLAVHIAKTVGDTTSAQLCTVYNRLGNSYEILNDYKKQRIYQNKALALAINHNDAEEIHTVASNLARCIAHLGYGRRAIFLLNGIVKKHPLKTNTSYIMVERSYIEIYRILNQTSLGRKHSDRLEQIVSGSVLLDGELRYIYSALVPFYIIDKNYKKAETCLKLSRELALRANFGQHLYFNYLWTAKLDSTRGDYLAAFENYRKFSTLKDSVFNDNKTRQLIQLEIIYDVEKKNDNIHFLTKQSVLQKNSLKQANMIQNITNVSIVLLLIIIALLIYGYRLTQKNNKKITAKQDEINLKNISLGRLLTEKEWLIKEIHHRVKNNLHMVAGLLDSQSEYLKGAEARMAVADSQHRIQSMSMIHQRLYQTENLSSIDMSAYIHEMVHYLKDSFDSDGRILFNLEIDRVEMNISHSVPLGLILNEAITNAIKYAFPGNAFPGNAFRERKEGLISITLKEVEPDRFTLIIADNGIGLRPDFDIKQTNSFGWTLIQGLTDDISGQLNIHNDKGTVVQINFLYQQVQKRTS
ncbi:histidine kinase dimerization/phosphoacceptor domain -containing protein [Dyadobacter sp. NIV53]|uniref:histidine kinase dimerization/phosphoacceptor domain -containing protein n=1 Tax=Dyadobacter sp. NIV53 TaxID=2861765 RepID=UPI001C86AB0E|nr:histidine kinase dimerization/phosphoacceptor domain -containing protein [Dyadobacter sp. NIV53]